MAQNDIKIKIAGKLDETAFKKAQAELGKLKEKAGNSQEGFNKLGTATEELVGELAGLNGPAAMAAEALMAFGGGGVVAGSVAIGVASIIAIIGSYISAADRAEQNTRELALGFAELEGKGEQVKLNQLRQELADLETQAKSTWRTFWLGSDGRLFGFGDSDSERIGKAQLEVARAEKRVADAEKQARDAEARSADELAIARAQLQGRGTQQSLAVARRRTQEAEAAFRALSNATPQQIAEAQATLNEARAKELQAQKAHNDAVANAQKSAADRAKAARDKAERDRKEAEENAKRARDAEIQNIMALSNLGAFVQYSPEQVRMMNQSIMKFYDEATRAEMAGNFQLAAQMRQNAATLSAARDQNRNAAAGAPTGLLSVDDMGIDATLANAQAGVVELQNSLNALGIEKMNELNALTQQTAFSFIEMFTAIGQGANVFKTLGGGIANLFAGIARQKVAYNIAEGVENLAKSFGWISSGNPALAAAAKTAAAGHFKAAALWGGVAAGAGVAGASFGGGGSGGGVSTAVAVGNDRMTQLFDSRGESTLIINGGILDMTNPDQANALTNAVNELGTRRRLNIVVN